ncbi:MAG: prenyltransferase [Thaumarchaeota archaeon]|nr:MAG: prenyltransferase [Nitrososphaerota archaeon]
MPYVLGAAAAQYTSGAISVTIFVIGLMGVLGALLGVETYNEFFETRTGSDMVFESEPPPAKPVSTFVLGSFGFAVFVTTGIYLASLAGALILVIAAYGLQAAIFYVGPPIKWAYRGVGESVIALAYGPFMTIGS